MEIFKPKYVGVMIFISSICALSPVEIDFVHDYFWTLQVSGIKVYPCSQADGLATLRSFHQSSHAVLLELGVGVGVGVGVGNGFANKYKPPDTDIRSRGVLADIECPEVRNVVQKASSLSRMTDTLHWLLWSSVDDNDLQDFLESLSLNIDVDVVLVKSYNNTLQIFDLYKIKPSWPLTSTPIISWDLSEKKYLPNIEEILRKIRYQRIDFQGMELRAAVVLHGISADPQKNPLAFQAAITSRADRHLDSESRFGYAVYTHLQEIFNFTMSIVVTDSWGYRTNNSTTFDGMVGMLCQGLVQLGITPAIFNTQRLQVVDFTTPTWRLRTCFLFRHPRLLVPYKALVEPFVATTWGVTFLFSILVIVLLRIVSEVENRQSENIHSHTREGEGERDAASWSLPILTVVGVLSQQGAPSEPQLTSGRIILLTKLALSLLLYAFYTSAIVTFLLTPVPRTIRTAEDLIRSPLTLALEDYSYNRAVFPNSNDSLISRIWREKVGVRGGGGFVDVAEAVHRMRSEHFAYYSEDSTIYVPIDETFDDSEKCDLSEVELSAPSPNGAPLQKHSPYRELFNRALLRMWEHGIRSRQRNIWSARRPQCLTDGTTTVAAVGLGPIFPAHALLLAGLAMAMAIFLREKFGCLNNFPLTSIRLSL